MSVTVEVNALCKTFELSKKQMKIEGAKERRKVAVDHLSFDARDGEIFGLLGPNGAGKTTTLRILATLIKADEGDALVNGYSVAKNPEKVRERIGFLTSELKQEDFFTPNYLFGFFASLYGIESGAAKKRKEELFGRFGIDGFSEVKVANLSSGMKQKVSLALSIIHDPGIIIFDEPTNGLDVITAKAVTDFLADLKESGKTIIISTHIFSIAEKLCDRIGIIIDGKMAAFGRLGEITGESSLEDVFFRLYEEAGGILL